MLFFILLLHILPIRSTTLLHFLLPLLLSPTFYSSSSFCSTSSPPLSYSFSTPPLFRFIFQLYFILLLHTFPLPSPTLLHPLTPPPFSFLSPYCTSPPSLSYSFSSYYFTSFPLPSPTVLFQKPGFYYFTFSSLFMIFVLLHHFSVA